MPNPVYTYIRYTWFWKHFVDNVFKRAWANFFGTRLNGFMYCYESLTIQLNISHYTQLNDQIVLFLDIQFSTQFQCQAFLFDP